jgi:hypothetical protein
MLKRPHHRKRLRYNADMKKLNKAAAELGRLGGKAGTGAKKRRGGKAYYKALAAKATAARGKMKLIAKQESKK